MYTVFIAPSLLQSFYSFVTKVMLTVIITTFVIAGLLRSFHLTYVRCFHQLFVIARLLRQLCLLQGFLELCYLSYTHGFHYLFVIAGLLRSFYLSYALYFHYLFVIDGLLRYFYLSYALYLHYLFVIAGIMRQLCYCRDFQSFVS